MISKGLTDYSGKVCPRFNSYEGNDWPMYSFDTPAFDFWNGFANGLKARGLTDDQIKAELQSKGMRWMLDKHGEELEQLGLTMAARYSLCVTEETKP